MFNRNYPDENLEFVSEPGFDNVVKSGKRAVFVLKEVRPNVFHVLRMDVGDVTQSIGLSDFVAIVYYYVRKDYYGSKVFQVQSGTPMETVFRDANLDIDTVSSNVEVGTYFNYVINVANPSVRIKFDDFKTYKITSDTVMSVVYGDHQTFVGTFYGNLSSVDQFGQVSYPAVYDYGPVVYGENISDEKSTANNYLSNHNGDGKFFKVGDRILGWAQGSLNGPLYRCDVNADWSTPEEPGDFPSPDFYSITETVQKNLLSLDLTGTAISGDNPNSYLSEDGTKYHGPYLQIKTDGDDDEITLLRVLDDDGEEIGTFQYDLNNDMDQPSTSALVLKPWTVIKSTKQPD